MSERNKAIVRGYLEDVINRGQLEAIDTYFPKDFTFGGARFDAERLKALRQSFFDSFPDFHITILDQIAERDWVATRVTIQGSHQGPFLGIAPTAERVEVTGIAVDRVVDGKVIEMWHEIDTWKMLRQLGARPTLEGTS